MGFGRDADTDRQGALVYLDRAERDLAREKRAHDQTRSDLAIERETVKAQRARIIALEAQVRTLQAQRPAP